MKYFSTIIVAVIFSCLELLAQGPMMNVFLGSRNKVVNVYCDAVGHSVLGQVMEVAGSDDFNTIVIKDKSSLRFYVDIFVSSYTSSPVDITGWIDKSECAVYARPRNEHWNIYADPFDDYPLMIFDATDIEKAVPYLYVIDYISESLESSEQGYYIPWVKVGFIYSNKYYEGWTKDFCTDINYSCN